MVIEECLIRRERPPALDSNRNDAAKHFALLDSAIWLDLRPQDWRLLVQTLVWSARVVVSEVLVQDAAQMSFIA